MHIIYICTPGNVHTYDMVHVIYMTHMHIISLPSRYLQVVLR